MSRFFNAFHSPIGAHSSFTLGCLGAKGGLGLELGKPADQNVYIGVETRRGGTFEALPFFAGSEDEGSRFDHARKAVEQTAKLCSFNHRRITRSYALGTDCWKAGDLTFTIYSPVESVPDPDKTSAKEMRRVLCPAVTAELTIDNTAGKRPRRVFFGYSGGRDTDAMRDMNQQLSGSYVGVAKGNRTAIVSDSPGLKVGQQFDIEGFIDQPLDELDPHALGGTAALLADVPAGRKRTFRFAICFFRGGIVTSGEPTSYYYSRYFKRIEDVGRYALTNFGEIKQRARRSDRLVARKTLNADQRFQLVHAIRSYYGSTQFLDWDGRPFWVVNEGEYRMLNTFDLTVDQLFYEMRMNPWTVRNELDMFVKRYSYTDRLHFPGGKNEHPGGISFTHDMGICNRISRPGYSTYERQRLTGCFSWMTHEELVNWVLCAAVYAKQTGDRAWLKANLSVFKKCWRSMLNRDNPKAALRNGVMGLDSSRTVDGAEITTYDSLDESLGQSRNNLYMAVKCWAAYLAMEEIFTNQKQTPPAAQAARQADNCAQTIVSHVTDEGYIPAVMDEDSTSRIIPGIEGLVFPYVLGRKDLLTLNGRFGPLVRALKTHFETILKPGVCLYPDGGWKLSSTADNSWLSKIYICQFVARRILKIRTPATGREADRAHAGWLRKEENLYWAWSDQMTSGVAKGSKYYPRGVTSVLWLEEHG